MPVNILLLILISFTWQQEIDMLAIDDTLFIAMQEWRSYFYQATLYRYESNTLITEADLGDYSNVSIGYSGDVDERYILVACSNAGWSGDSLFAYDPADLSLIWKTGDLPWLECYEPEYRNLFMQRWHSEALFPRLISYYCSHVTDGDIQCVCSHAFNPDIYPVIWEDSLYKDSAIQGYIDDYFMGPVTVSEKPMITGLVNNIYLPGLPPSIIWYVWIHVHEAEADSIMRVLPVGGGQSLGPLYSPRGYCLGSCSSHAVLLWSDTTGTIYSTEVAGSPLEIVSTEPFGFNLPTGSQAIAASRNPNDSGILLCYYRDGYIWARYKEDFWFNNEHQVAPATSIYGGNLTVSGIPDGYWIAWKSGGNYPSIAWIDRETLTRISGEQSHSINNLCLNVSPNPFHGKLEVSVQPCSAPVWIDIYDTSGHRVHSGITDSSGHYTWDAQSMPSGVYLIQGTSGDLSLNVRFVKI